MVTQQEDEFDMPTSLKQPFALLHKIGAFSESKCKMISFIAVCSVMTLIANGTSVMQFMNIKNVSEFSYNLVPIAGYSQLLAKAVIMAYRKKDFINLLDSIKRFWDLNACDEETKTELKTIVSLTMGAQRFFLPLALITCTFMNVYAVLAKTVPLGIWTLESYNKLYYIALCAQIPLLTSAAFVICPFDCLYLAFCSEIIIQFRVLSYHLEHLTVHVNDIQNMDENQHKKMKKFIRQHQFLLKFVGSFQNIYSVALLIEYLTICPLLCLQLYVVILSEDIRQLLVYMVFFVQLCFFCIPNNYVGNQASRIAEAVYFSNWYSYNLPSLRVSVPFMIQNAQPEITIKGGGLITMNATTVVNVLKVSWSVASILRGVK